MLPLALTALTLAFPLILIRVLLAVNVVVDRIILVNVDVDIASVPVGVTPRIAPRRTDSSTGHKGKRGRSGHISRGIDRSWRIGRVCPCAVHNGRVIGRYINNLRTGGFDDDDLLIDLDNLFLGRFQVARCLRLCPKLLDRPHDILLLCEERVAQFLCPVDFFAHHGKDIGEVHQGFNARVPWLRLKGFCQRVTLQTLILLCPAIRLYNLKRIRGGHQYLGKQGVRIKGYGGKDLLKLFGFEYRW